MRGDRLKRELVLAGGGGGRALDTVYLMIALCALWIALSVIAGEHAFTSPIGTLRRLALLASQADFLEHVAETGRAFALALVFSIVGGLGLGVLLGAHRLSGEVAEPLLVALYSIPKITLYPVILLFFGLGMSAKVAFGALHGIVPVVLFTMAAVRNIPAAYVRTARAMRLSTRDTVLGVLLPAALPEIVSGFRLGFALTLLGTMIGEMFASQRGIGHTLMKAMEANDTPTIMALALLLILFATAISSMLLKFDNHLHHR